MLRFPAYHPNDLLREVPDLEGKTLLDVGAGTHCSFCVSYIHHIYQRTKNEHEKDEETLQNSWKLIENTVAVDKKYKDKSRTILPQISVCGDALNLPFSNESFDIVTMGFLLDYFSEDSKIEQVISESARVLKPKGHMIGDVPLYLARPPTDRLRIPKLLLDAPRYFEQRKKYLKIMEKNNLISLKRGMGVYDFGKEKHLVFYFITQKR